MGTRQDDQNFVVRFLHFGIDNILLDLVLEVLASNEVGDIILLVSLLALLQVLVALGELAEGGERVGAELVKDPGNELSQLLVLTVAVDGEGVSGDGGMNYCQLVPHIPSHYLVSE